MKLCCRLSLLAVLLLMAALAAAEQDWKLVKSIQNEGIDIYYRPAPEAEGLVEFKATVLLDSPLLPAIAVIRDVASMHEWVYQVQSAEIIERVDERQRYIHIKHFSPVIGLGRRDSIVLSSMRQDPASKTVVIEGEARPDYREEVKGYVRIPEGKSSWTFEPRPGRQVWVTFQGYANPGGAIEKAASSFLAKKFLWKLPGNSLKNLKQQVQLPRYQSAVTPGIVEALE